MKSIKMKRGLIICLLMWILGLSAGAQTVTVSGYISDEKNGETLINATVYNPATEKGTVSNLYGFYSLTLPKTEGEVELIFSFLGYTPQSLRVSLLQDTLLSVQLSTDLMLEEVTVLGGTRHEISVQGAQMSAIDVPISQIKGVPSLFGENDLIKALQLLPGVQGGTEGSAGMYVRGGGPDENLLLLDGIPVYNVNHLLGFFSVFNSDAIKNVTLYKGNFPARFGGRLSSVVDIRMKDGNNNKIHGNIDIGAISTKANLEGPLGSDKTTFNLSFRRTYADLLIQPIIRYAMRDEFSRTSAGYYFYDFNAKLSHTFSDKDRIYLSFYSGDDKIYTKIKQNQTDATFFEERGWIGIDWAWGNLISALRWNHVVNNKLFMNTTAAYTRYRFDMYMRYEYELISKVPPLSEESEKISMGYLTGIDDYTLKTDFDYSPDPAHTIRFGGNLTYHTFKPGVSAMKSEAHIEETDHTLIDTTYGGEKIYAFETALYAEDNWDVNDWLKINMGLHHSSFSVQKTFYHSFQPRVGVRVLMGDNLSLKAGYARMSQYIHMLSNSSVSLPTDLWVPVTKRIVPMNSHQFSAGLFYNLLGQFDLSVEGYYKRMDNLLEYKDGATFLGSTTGWEDKVCMGNGWSYGIEFLVQKSVGNTTGWIGYTWAHAGRLFNEENNVLNFGRPFPAKYDRRHDVSITLSHKFGENIDLSATWIYATGNCGTLALQEFEGIAPPYTNEYSSAMNYIDGRNNYRYNPYHRLDLGVNFHKQKRHGVRTINVSVYNVYNRNNPFYVYASTESEYIWNPVTQTEVISKTFNQVSIFPIIPSVSYSYKF